MNTSHVPRAFWSLIAACGFACTSWASGANSPGVFFSETTPFRIEIEVPADYSQKLNAKSRDYVPALIRVGNSKPVKAGIRLRGLSSFQPLDRKPAFALKLTDSASREAFGGLSKLLFNNGVAEHCCPREVVANDLFRAAGVPAARTRIAHVTLNQRAVGPYVVMEAMNKDFLLENFGDASGNLYEGTLQDIDQQLERDNGTDSSDAKLRDLVNACRELDKNLRWDRIRNILEVDQFLKFAAVQMLLGHKDGYLANHNNYRLYHNPGSGKFTFIPHGLDTVFIRGASMVPPTNSIVMKAIWSIPEARERYLSICSTLVSNVWRLEVITNRIEELTRAVAQASTGSQTLYSGQSCSDFLAAQVTGRHQEVVAWLCAPEPRPIQLVPGGSTNLAHWSSFTRSGSPSLAMMTNAEGTYLQIEAQSPAVAGWKLDAQVPEGEYSFSCRALAKPSAGPSHAKVPTLMTRLAGDLGGAALTQYGEWVPLTYRFLAPQGGRVVEFLCELQAGSGEILLDSSSITLSRLK